MSPPGTARGASALEDEREAASRFAVRTRRVEARARREGKRAEKREKTRYELEYERRLRDAGAADATMRREELEEKQRRVASEKAREESVRRRFAIESREGTKIGPVKAGVGRGSLLRAGLVSPVASPMGKKEARERALATSDGDDERRGGDAAAAGRRVFPGSGRRGTRRGDARRRGRWGGRRCRRRGGDRGWRGASRRAFSSGALFTLY